MAAGIEGSSGVAVSNYEFPRSISQNALPVGIKISHSSPHSATPGSSFISQLGRYHNWRAGCRAVIDPQGDSAEVGDSAAARAHAVWGDYALN
jgi:hypothetical protein